MDWYNKIISHNEVPRNHPDRDKKRGRIWRVKHQDQTPLSVPDFTKLTGDELLLKLGGDSLAQHHLAWQAITDRQMKELVPALHGILSGRWGGRALSDGARIGALWALEGLGAVDAAVLKPLLADANRNVRREAVRAFGQAQLPHAQMFAALEPLAGDPDPEVRAEVIRSVGPLVARREPRAVALCVKLARAPLAEPTAKSTQSGKIIKVREAYEREFERYLARLFLEQSPEFVGDWLNTDEAVSFPVENRLVATLALEPRVSAGLVSKLLPQLTRPPGQEEVLRLAQFLDGPGVADALRTLMQQPATGAATLEALLKVRTKLDATKLIPLLTDAARALWKKDSASVTFALRLVTAFKLSEMGEDINQALIGKPTLTDDQIILALRAQRELGANQLDGILAYVKSPRRNISDEALLALASSHNPLASDFILNKFWNDFSLQQHRLVLSTLVSARAGASAVVKAVESGAIDKADLDAATLDKLHAVLGDDKNLAALMQQMAALFRPVLRLDGKDDSWVDSDITLDGPFTVETWIKLDPGIDNNDGILGAPGVLDMNFFDAKFRVWVGGATHDAIIAKKSVLPDSWTHVCVTRDADGKFRLYHNGELDTDQSKAAPQRFEHCRIGWTAPAKGTAAWLTEYRVWNRLRTAEEIRADFDRSFEGDSKPDGLTHYFSGSAPGWGKLHGSAKVEKTSDFPLLLTAAEARLQAEKFTKFRALAGQSGDLAHGKALFTTACMICHSVGGQGAQIGPVLNGAGASGVEALLRNILTPNAAMEAGYRMFRIELKNGDLLDGLLVSEDKDAIILRRPNSEDQRIPQTQVRRAEFTKLSIMPEGLLDALKPEEVTDLFAYLKTLK